MVSHFELQPAEAELQQLAGRYWEQAGDKEKQLEREAFEAGAAIRDGEYTLANLEAIVRWKSERIVHYLIANSGEQIKRALEVAASPDASVRGAIEALTSLRGIDLPVASAILAAIFPERYTVLDFRTLEALGHARHDVEFYADYIACLNRMAGNGLVKPQDALPGPTALHTLERALWEWSRTRSDQGR